MQTMVMTTQATPVNAMGVLQACVLSCGPVSRPGDRESRCTTHLAHDRSRVTACPPPPIGLMAGSLVRFVGAWVQA